MQSALFINLKEVNNYYIFRFYRELNFQRKINGLIPCGVEPWDEIPSLIFWTNESGPPGANQDGWAACPPS
jgi:hypothetical protein